MTASMFYTFSEERVVVMIIVAAAEEALYREFRDQASWLAGRQILHKETAKIHKVSFTYVLYSMSRVRSTHRNVIHI